MAPVAATEIQAKRLAAQAGVPVPRGTAHPTPEEAATGAASLRPPLVLKAFGPGLLHKSDAGAVRLGLDGPGRVHTAAEEMLRDLKAQGLAPDGFLVEEQCPPGAEVIVGAVADPSFGPLLLVGLGGVWAEALDDTVVLPCPLEPGEAARLPDRLRGAALLRGGRGAPPVDRAALASVIEAVGGPGGLVERLGPALSSFELNPVIAGPDGAMAADARLLVADGSPVPGDLPPAVAGGRSSGGAPPTDFTRLSAPRGVAVVGASTRGRGFGSMFLSNYRSSGYPGTLVAVHPTAREVEGVPAVPTLADVPPETDYALVAVPAAACADAVRQARGIPFVQVVGDGFAESGPEGAAREAELVAAARQGGGRLLGPNCMGVYSPAGGQTFLGGPPGAPGRVGLVAQSGGLAGEVVRVGERRGLRFSTAATVGNAADVGPDELVRYLVDDPGTGVVGLYVERPPDGRALARALRAARGRVPTAVLVGGRSRQGRRAAASHTGALAGDARVWTGLAARCGFALVRSQEELLAVLEMFDLQAGRPAGGGSDVLVVGPSGGAGVLAADAFDAAGAALPPLGPEAEEALRAAVPRAAAGNPLEIPLGPLGPKDLARAAVAAVCGARPYPDAVAHANVQSFAAFAPPAGGGAGDTSTAEAVRAGLLEYVGHLGHLQEEVPGTRVSLVLRNVECGPPDLLDTLRPAAREAGIPCFTSMETAAVAVMAAKTFATARDEAEDRADP
ncbi:acetate--CoA ligase family protein [Nocardiopsis sp. RSe5-2]|uniref:Acetate--CoA ligase family protein n=1 Tax=Nocardiopsis endophytica TaxID=3018445 RepID=A0ABT4U524_9ACTN|nr:acetate--CoA ligase family protein [Nocardiopsis endophytica]MDA2812056.1 acetate--CoA ligase family protein [Nocardiopsis endophytica]